MVASLFWVLFNLFTYAGREGGREIEMEGGLILCICAGVWPIVQARPAGKKHHSKHGRHDRALKKVTTLKNEARKEFRRAKRNGTVEDEVSTLAKNFFQSVRKRSALKKKSNN